jgi:hypothetical protein
VLLVVFQKTFKEFSADRSLAKLGLFCSDNESVNRRDAVVREQEKA